MPAVYPTGCPFESRFCDNAVQGISTRSVDDLVRAMGMEGISKSQVSRLCGEIDERVQTFLSRPIEGEWPYVWLDATYVKARRDHHIVSVAVIVAVGVNTDGRREVLGRRSATVRPSHSGSSSCAASHGAACAARSW
jgi:putative transposase